MHVQQDYLYAFFWLIPILPLSKAKTLLECRQCSNQFDEGMDWPFDFGDSAETLKWECRRCGEWNPNTRFTCKKCGGRV